MKPHIAELLLTTAIDAGSDLEIRSDYSGRGMYGEATTAVMADNWKHFLLVVAHTVEHLTENDPDDGKTLNDLYDDLEHLKSDSLGLGLIFY